MKYEIGKSFQKNLSKTNDKNLAIAIIQVIEDVVQATNLSEVSNIKKNEGL